MKEKTIEQGIAHYLERLGAVVESMQSGKVMIKKGNYNNRMTLQKEGCPDIVCFYQGHFIGIEVKKNQEEVNKWLKLKERYEKGEVLPKSYKRELDQIKYRNNILDNGGTFIITWEIEEVIGFIESLEINNNN